ncbi:hypothetical protein AURDEDRAFT_163723 [Auricularia subglabra TFB-10046 SS5]|nr:hypothetical protein AURDEDRAFT_163723 [Auricularia subglabra TFB-10046 SS5]
MPKARARPSAPPTTRSRGAVLRKQKLALPDELVADILEYLPPGELWAAARVSRQFYAACWRAGVFIHRSIFFSRDEDHPRRISMFMDVLEHAKQKGLNLSLSIRFCFPVEDDPIHRVRNCDYLRRSVEDLSRAITEALPLLVYLSIQLLDHFRDLLAGALCHAAPRLRNLELTHNVVDSPYLAPLLRDLFDGSAPKLRTLALEVIALPSMPVDALKPVTHASLTYQNTFPQVDFGHHFPHLKSLQLEFFVHNGEKAVASRFDFTETALRSLSVGDYDGTTLLDAIEGSTNLSAIPSLEFIGHRIPWSEALWAKDPARFSMRVFEDNGGFTCVFVTPEHQRWRRRYRLGSWNIATAPPGIQELPNLGTRLAYLRIQAHLLPAFLTLELCMSVLHDLHVDVHCAGVDRYWFVPFDCVGDARFQSFDPGTQGAPRVWLPCPALAEITLFALDEPMKDMNSRHVALLAHALGQFERPKAQKARADRHRIRKYAFAGRGSREDYDEGLWERDF